MHRLRTSCFCLLILLPGLSTPSVGQDVPTPAVLKQFLVPMPDGTNATAFVLRTDTGQVLLCLATKNGQVGLWTMTPGPSPLPPTPDPTPPPLPSKLHVAVVVDPARLSVAERNVLADRQWRDAATAGHWFHGVIPNDVQEGDTGKPPASLLPFLQRAALHNLPWVIMCDQSGTIIWEGPLPKTKEEMRSLIPKPSTPRGRDGVHNTQGLGPHQSRHSLAA